MISPRAVLLGIGALMWCPAVAADPGASAIARSHFEAGIAAIGRGALEQGLQEFQAAYAAEPRFAVLFNIGQAQSALGRPLDAIASFERFLAEGGPKIPEARRAEVTRLIEQNRKRTGTLLLKVEAPADARVWLDGMPLSADKLTDPFPTSVGEHLLLHSHGRGFPQELRVRVEPEKATEVVIAAPPPEPPPPQLPTGSRTGQLAIACKIAGIDVEIAGKSVGRTPLPRPVTSQTGMVSVRFARAGYEPVVREVPVQAGQTSSLVCSLPLTPTRASVERTEAAARRRVLGYGLAGAALASLGAGAAIYGWNQGRYDDWRDSRTADDPMVDRAVSIQRADDAAVGLAILGVGLSAFATWAFVTAN